MAHVLSQAEVDLLVSRNTRDNVVRYPWSKWTTGEWWIAVRGDDFVCEPSSFRMAAILHGRRQNTKCTTYVVGDAVVFRFAVI